MKGYVPADISDMLHSYVKFRRGRAQLSMLERFIQNSCCDHVTRDDVTKREYSSCGTKDRYIHMRS